jgi:hypothetical protein
MEKIIENKMFRMMIFSAYLVIAGSFLSGPGGYLIVNLANPISWTNVSAFAAQYHYIQTLPYWFGFLYLAGFILFISICSTLMMEKNRYLGNSALITTSIFAALIGINYLLQVGYVPKAIARPNEILAAFTMNNPNSICWILEMFGWGFLGVALWLVISAFDNFKFGKIIKGLIILNGAGSVVAAALAALLPSSLLLQIPGLIAYFAWNILIWVIMVLVVIDLRKNF